MKIEGKEEDTLVKRIDIQKYFSYIKLLRVTARVLALYSRNPKATFCNAIKPMTPQNIEQAELIWIRDCQKPMVQDIAKGKFKRLSPKLREDGIVVVRNITEKWVHMSYNKSETILLPYNHKFSRLYAEYSHRKGHYGVSSTESKIRSKFWINNLHRMVKSIRYNCVICKKLDKRLKMQVMGKLPVDRLKPSQSWYSTAIDLF